MFLIVKIKGRGVLVLGLGTQRGVYPPKESTVESQLYNHFIWWGLTGWVGIIRLRFYLLPLDRGS